ncbi:MAG: hypothetical protein WAO55_00470 [Candidatus Manganitrophaceae bacterium]
METVKYTERKWRANAEKVAFAKSFPGRLPDWKSAEGKAIERVIEAGPSVQLVLFSDGTFVVTPLPELEPAPLIAALLAARPFLERYHREGYETLDRHILTDREMQRMARLENIVGAIKNNLPQIPELRDELRRFLERTEESVEGEAPSGFGGGHAQAGGGGDASPRFPAPPD